MLASPVMISPVIGSPRSVAMPRKPVPGCST
jgi:hypothetical protein